MPGLTLSMEALIQAFKKLPGVGPRTAERFVFFILSQPISLAKELAQAVLKVKQTIGFCRVCFNLADEELCPICRDPGRDHSVICVVEHPRAIIALEKAGGYKGVYHVLLGALSPLDGIGPRDLKVQELKSRVKAGGIKEVILATDSDLEGEATALYLTKELKALSLGAAQEGAAAQEGVAAQEAAVGPEAAARKGAAVQERAAAPQRVAAREGEATPQGAAAPKRAVAREGARGLEPGLKVSRLASGIPMGSTVEFADQVTLNRALEGRRAL